MIMHFLPERIKRLLNEMKKNTARSRVDITGIEICPRGGEWSAFENGSYWGGDGGWYDFRFHVTVPESFGDRAALWIKTGREGQWDATNPQFVVRVNGEIVQAFDTNHTRLPLKKGEYDILLNGYTPETPALTAAPILYLHLADENDELIQLIFDIDVPLESVSMLLEGDRERETTLEILGRACDMLDLRRYHSAAFDESVAAARAYLKQEFYDKRADLPSVAVAQCVGHTHIDVAWLWDLYQTRSKAVRSFSTVLALMDRYPEYKFMSSQPVLYKFVQEDEPELFERIKAAVARGQWEPEGGMWVEADCNLAGGESLARQFLHGQGYFEKEFGKRGRILWLPDVFGYSAALPQLCKLSGIDYFMTTKISWSEYNTMPYDTFIWKGVDGTEMLTHFSPSRDDFDVSKGVEHFNFTTYNTMLNPNQISGGWKRFQQKGIDDHYLVSFGYGDGGGGPTESMLDNARRMTGSLPGLPKVEMCHARPFFEALEKRVKGDPNLPKWSGELYLEYHRGTYTGMSRNKRSNRKMELGLRDAELLSLMAGKYPRKELYDIWEDVLTLQFHDILPGSSIEKVYIDSKEMYERRGGELKAITDAAVQTLAPAGEGLTIFNTLARERDDIAVFDAPEGTAYLVCDGGKYPVQKGYDGKYRAYVKNLPAMGGKGFAFEQGEVKGGLNVTAEAFDTPFFTGKFDEKMRIASMIVKENGRELAKEPLNRIVCYENKPHAHDAWDINIYYARRHWDIDDVKSAKVVENGPVRCVVQIEYAYMDSTVKQDVIFYQDIGRVDFNLDMDWKEKNCLVKAHFPMDIFYNSATYDIQYGNIVRPTHKHTPWDGARFEVCAHKWADVAENVFGVSLLNDCKYGHSCDENSLALSLLKSSTEPNPHSDQEQIVCTYALYPHVGSWQEANTPDMAYRLNVPVVTACGGNDVGSFVKVEAENVIVEAVKAAEKEDGVVIRVYECFGRRTNGVKLALGFAAEKAEVVNILEDKLADTNVCGGVITFDMKPYEIKTFKIGG